LTLKIFSKTYAPNDKMLKSLIAKMISIIMDKLPRINEFSKDFDPRINKFIVKV